MDYHSHLVCRNTRTEAYDLWLQSGNMDSYKAAAYNVRTPVKGGKKGLGCNAQVKGADGDYISWEPCLV